MIDTLRDPTFWTAIGSVATALTVGAASVQIFFATRQEKSEFEDGLAREYRELLGQLPVDVLRRQALTRELSDDDFRTFYRYLDLSNEQVFLRHKGRIRKDTWKEWSSGIRSNLQRPGFREAWQEVQPRPGFEELRALIDSGFADPRSRRWKRARKRD